MGKVSFPSFRFTCSVKGPPNLRKQQKFRENPQKEMCKLYTHWTSYMWYYWWKRSCTSWSGKYPHYLQGSIHPRWLFRISSNRSLASNICEYACKSSCWRRLNHCQVSWAVWTGRETYSTGVCSMFIICFFLKCFLCIWQLMMIITMVVVMMDGGDGGCGGYRWWTGYKSIVHKYLSQCPRSTTMTRIPPLPASNHWNFDEFCDDQSLAPKKRSLGICARICCLFSCLGLILPPGNYRKIIPTKPFDFSTCCSQPPQKKLQ